MGRIYNSEKYNDGTKIITKSIKQLYFEQEILIVKTKEDTYLLFPSDINKKYDDSRGGNVIYLLRLILNFK